MHTLLVKINENGGVQITGQSLWDVTCINARDKRNWASNACGKLYQNQFGYVWLNHAVRSGTRSNRSREAVVLGSCVYMLCCYLPTTATVFLMSVLVESLFVLFGCVPSRSSSRLSKSFHEKLKHC